MSDMIDLKTARVFLNFMVQYYALIRRHIVEANQFRFQSHGFSMLYTLRNHMGKARISVENFRSQQTGIV